MDSVGHQVLFVTLNAASLKFVINISNYTLLN